MSAEGSPDGDGPARHRADDDVEALASGSFAPVRTPNGAADLLSGEAATALAAAGPATHFSIDDEGDEEDGKPKADTGDGGNEPATPDKTMNRTDSTGSNGATAKMGAKVTKLSAKTTKIMSDYQAYLAEIETEFPNPEGDAKAGETEALNAAKDQIRDEYIRSTSQEGGTIVALPPVAEDKNYATGGGNGEAMMRDWDYGNPTIAIDRTGGGGGAAVAGRRASGGAWDDGVTDITDYESQMMLARGQKYTHHWLHSKRVKRGLMMIAAVGVIVGAAVGISTSQKNKKLKTLEGDMNEAGKAGGNGDGKTMNVSSGGTPQNGETKEEWEEEKLQDLYKYAVITYHPVTFNRENGWKGQTYTEALVFCGSKTGYAVCPYDVICPAGPDNLPLGGNIESPGDESSLSFLPILDAPNDWVQIGKDDECIRYSNMHAIPPAWGITGQDNEAITQNVMCCIGDSLASQASYEENMERYQPKEFTRGSSSGNGSGDGGWNGQTYAEAVQFCEAIEGYNLCSYEALCPLGASTEPLGGVKGGGVDENGREGMAWVPVLNSLNEWVQVGSEDSCVAYTHEHRDKPAWGITGEGNEEITRNVICCLEQEETMKESGNAGAYEAAVEYYHPHLFDRSKGWAGTSYPDAVDFCESLIDGYEVCPYDAICPLGLDHEPSSSYQPGEFAWVPMLDIPNEFVQIARGDACSTYSTLHGNPPDWGVTGEGAEELTKYVMCCAKPGFSPDPNVSPKGPEGHTGEKVQGPAHSEADVEAYSRAAGLYMPEWFNRYKGWTGKTYLEALQFCSDKANSEVCPLEAICPLGPDTEPLGGFREEPGGGASWVPISNGPNSWVQVSSTHGGGSCIQYDHENADPNPEWGLTGVGDEEMTRHVACCLVQDPAETIIEEVIAAGASDASSAGREGTPVSVPVQIAPPPTEWMQEKEYGEEVTEKEKMDAAAAEAAAEEEFAAEKFAAEAAEEQFAAEKYASEEAAEEAKLADLAYANMAIKYHPIWYDRSEGWSGQTYLEAFEFCGKSIEGYGLCPVDAICPLGAGSEPLGGLRGDKIREWVAISDKPNGWVQVSSKSDPGGPCVRYSESHSGAPQWGVTGENNEGRTRHLVCCLFKPDDDVTAGLVSEEEEQSAKNEVLTPEQLAKNEAEDELLAEEYNAKEMQMHEAALEAMKEDEEAAAKYQAEMAAAAEAAAIEAQQASASTANKPASTAATAVPAKHEDVPFAIVNEDGVSIDQINEVYMTVSKMYKPKWFNREKNWLGQTHNDAMAFCEDFSNNFPCPYEAICPLGKGSKPLGGYKNGVDGGESWVPLRDEPNSWVKVDDGDGSCVKYSHLHPGPPEWGVTGEGNEEMTRNIACCTDVTPEPTPEPTQKPTPKPTLKPTLKPTKEPTPSPVTPSPIINEALHYEEAAKAFEPLWFNRGNNWKGTSYLESLQFCAQHESRVPCPYEAYCPAGEGKKPLGGIKEGVSWAPMIDAPNSWVSVGGEKTCTEYSSLNKSPPSWGLTGKDSEDLTRHIMCCVEQPVNVAPVPTSTSSNTPFTETEQVVLDTFKAEWFGRDDGYQGTTYLEAAKFCNHIAGMELCPVVAYCPNGAASPTNPKPLFLQMPPFPEEQWAPIAIEDDGRDDIYLHIGTKDGDLMATCQTYLDLNGGAYPPWGVDGSQTELKKYVLCCKDPSFISAGIDNPTVDLQIGGPAITDQQMDEENFDVETAIAKDLDPKWYGPKEDWRGGSHQDAEVYCDTKGRRQICPYAAYCPHGPGQPIASGHTTDISSEGIQWAPVFGHENHWVMIGRKHGNSATTCFGHEDLEGEAPDWGLTRDRPEIKLYVMCCVVNN